MEKSLKIRHWFLGRIYAAGNSSVKLESVRETARKFGVAQCTVSAVTASLIRDNWLIPRKGIGIFTNPQKLAGDSARKLVGLLNGDGKMFYYNAESFAVFSAVGGALLKNGFHFRSIQLECSTPEGIAQELQCSGISSLIWCARDVLIPEAVLQAVVRTGLPVLCDVPGCPYFPVIREDFEAILEKWGEWMKERRMKNLLIDLLPWHCRCFAGFFREKFPELSVETVCSGSGLPERSCDLILTGGNHPAGENVRNWRELPGKPEILQVPDYEKMAKAFAEALFQTPQPKEIKIKPQIKEI